MVDKNYIIISGYTIDTPYEVETRELKKTLKKFDLPYHITGIPTKSSWRENCRAMNYIILEAFDKYPDKDIVWLDADARVRKPLTLFDDYRYDIGMYLPVWPPGSGQKECRTGTIYFRNIAPVRDFFQKYVDDLAAMKSDFEPEKLFGELVKTSGLNYDLYFPGEYCMVFCDNLKNVDRSMFSIEGIEPGFRLEDIVILQNMSMKRYAKKVDKDTPSLSKLYENDINIICNRYRDRLEEFGPTLEALGIASEERTALRHKVAADVGPLQYCPVLDVGCGFGAFSKCVGDGYVGIDMTEEVIAVARERYKDYEFICADFLHHDFDRTFDYVICDGVFNNRYHRCDNVAIVKDAIRKCFSLATKGAAFSFMSKYVDYKDDYLYYYDPLEIFDFCKSLTKRVTLRHDYPLFEFCIYMYPDWEGWNAERHI